MPARHHRNRHRQNPHPQAEPCIPLGNTASPGSRHPPRKCLVSDRRSPQQLPRQRSTFASWKPPLSLDLPTRQPDLHELQRGRPRAALDAGERPRQTRPSDFDLEALASPIAPRSAEGRPAGNQALARAPPGRLSHALRLRQCSVRTTEHRRGNCLAGAGHAQSLDTDWDCGELPPL